MKRGTIDHPKMRRLVRALGCHPLVAIGLLESLWHWTARYAPIGDIGKYSDEDIADGIGWTGAICADLRIDACALLRILCATGWIDADQRYRLLIHDWHQHCDEATKKAAERNKITLISDVLPPVATSPDTVPTSIACPSLPSPSLPSPSLPREKTCATAVARDDGFAQFWATYPKRKGKSLAQKAWRKLRPDTELQSVIIAAVTSAATSDDWQRDDGKFIPYPASWLNARRWEDEPDVTLPSRDPPCATPSVGRSRFESAGEKTMSAMRRVIAAVEKESA
jgi:hypothetical protein